MFPPNHKEITFFVDALVTRKNAKNSANGLTASRHHFVFNRIYGKTVFNRIHGLRSLQLQFSGFQVLLDFFEPSIVIICLKLIKINIPKFFDLVGRPFCPRGKSYSYLT